MLTSVLTHRNMTLLERTPGFSQEHVPATQDAVEPALPGHSHRPLRGDAKRRGGDIQCNPVRLAATARLNGVKRSPKPTMAWRSRRAGASSRV